MHQALYRKWRPRTFSEVCGQDHITEILKYEVENKLFSHAYLFCGSRGTGKTTCAKILARAVNCTSPVGGDPCGKCPSCVSILEGRTTDVLEMDAASNNRVDDIRSILDEVVFTPGSLRYRVYIIDEVHMLSSSAFNALLKTLEEPPEHVIFILATTELQKLPATIISRCQRFDFHRIPTRVLTSRLEFIAKNENIELDPDAALLISRLARGGMRDAISLFELCSAGRDRVTADVAAEAAGYSGRGETSAFVRGVKAGKLKEVFGVIDRVERSSRDLGVFWQELTGYHRDMLVMKTLGKQAGAGYLDLTDSEAELVWGDAALFSKEKLVYQISLLDSAYASMQRAGTDRRAEAEIAAVRMCDDRLDTSPEALAARIEALEAGFAVNRRASGAAVTVTPEPSAETPAPTQAKTEPVPDIAKKSDRAPQRIRNWTDVTEILRSTSPGTAALLNSAAGYISENGGTVRVTVKYKTEVTKRLATAPEIFGVFCSALSKVTGKTIYRENVTFEPGTQDELKPETDELSEELNSIITGEKK